MSLFERQYPIGQFVYPSQISNHDMKNWITDIEQLPSKLNNAVESLSKEQLDLSYRTNGWAIWQLVHHIADSHMNGYIRFQLAMTEHKPVIKPYDQDKWVSLPYLKNVSVESSLELIEALHSKWAALLESLTQIDLKRKYVHPEEGKTISLGEAICLYAWHGNHHLAHINTALKKMQNQSVESYANK